MSRLTSTFVTGFSANTRCVNRGKDPKTSRSASCFKSFEARTRFLRFGMAFDRVGWMADIRFRASSKVVIRGDRGKFPRTWMSLSVKSIESWGFEVGKIQR
jgi:hypothetical protein